jgi:hypothetical protein
MNTTISDDDVVIQIRKKDYYKKIIETKSNEEIINILSNIIDQKNEEMDVLYADINRLDSKIRKYDKKIVEDRDIYNNKIIEIYRFYKKVIKKNEEKYIENLKKKENKTSIEDIIESLKNPRR